MNETGNITLTFKGPRLVPSLLIQENFHFLIW